MNPLIPSAAPVSVRHLRAGRQFQGRPALPSGRGIGRQHGAIRRNGYPGVAV